MRRRDLLKSFWCSLGILGSSVVLWATNGLAQATSKRVLIGFLGASSKSAGGRYYRGFPQGMQERGYQEGIDYLLIERYADGQVEKLPALAQGLVSVGPDVIVVSNTSAALATRGATSRIPIVVGTLTDPVGMGLAVSEARPGGNVTGILQRLEGLTGKQLELAKDFVPGASRIGVLTNVNNPADMVQRGTQNRPPRSWE